METLCKTGWNLALGVWYVWASNIICLEITGGVEHPNVPLATTQRRIELRLEVLII